MREAKGLRFKGSINVNVKASVQKFQDLIRHTHKDATLLNRFIMYITYSDISTIAYKSILEFIFHLNNV